MKNTYYLIFIGLIVSMLPLAAQTPDTVRFIHLSDPHICFLDEAHPLIQSSRDHYGHGVTALENFLDTQSTKPGIDFIALTGDMIDYYNAHTATRTLKANQIEQFLPILQYSRVPVYLTLGNHDIATYSVDDASKLKSTQLQAQTARAEWIRQIPAFANGTYYSQVIPVGHTTYRLIFLDNSYYDLHPTPDDDAFLFNEEQLDWLDWQLKQAVDEKVIIFTHMPFKSEKQINPGRRGLFELLSTNPSVQLMLCGHRHINDVHHFHANGSSGFTQVMTGAFGRDPNNWRLITLTESGIAVSEPGNAEQALFLPGH